MLHQTHHNPFFFCPFSPFSHSSLSPHLRYSSSSSSVSHPLQGMECVQSTLVSGFASEMALQTASILEETSAANGVSGDDLFVDELLDFSNEFNEEEEKQPQKLEETEEKELEEKVKSCSVSLEKQTAPEKSVISVKDDFGPLPESEISVPVEEGLESLEWLSHFVEDSFSDYSLTGKLTSMAEVKREPEILVKEQICFTTPVQTKARTKRARTGIRVWPVLSPPFPESSTSSSSSTSSATSFPFAPPDPWAVQDQTGKFLNVKPPVKKHKKKPAGAGSAGGGGGQPRRCSHCGVTKTPQWRAGPLGSKTLCNACGVRFKSGRLLPEYRPACSPTFSSQLHSNNHRKVLEMRRKKEPESETAAGLPPPVQSF